MGQYKEGKRRGCKTKDEEIEIFRMGFESIAEFEDFKSSNCSTVFEYEEVRRHNFRTKDEFDALSLEEFKCSPFLKSSESMYELSA